jgi:hypothetical protein
MSDLITTVVATAETVESFASGIDSVKDAGTHLITTVIDSVTFVTGVSAMIAKYFPKPKKPESFLTRIHTAINIMAFNSGYAGSHRRSVGTAADRRSTDEGN